MQALKDPVGLALLRLAQVLVDRVGKPGMSASEVKRATGLYWRDTVEAQFRETLKTEIDLYYSRKELL